MKPWTVPDHVTKDRILDFNYLDDPRLEKDIHNGLLALKAEAPEIFWTPANGGHWVVTDSELMSKILKTPKLFSNKQLQIPARDDAPRMIPESLDPPEHLLYRRLMMEYFEKSRISHLQERVDYWTDFVLEELKTESSTEFVETVASRLPIYIFMEFAGFPMDRAADFRELADGMFRSSDPVTRQTYAMKILGEVQQVITAKLENPGDDILSKLTQVDFQDRKLNFEELMSIAFLMFVAGLDTVTNAMTFGIRHMALDPVFRRKLAQNPDRIPDAIDELMRRYTFPTLPRQITEDMEFGGVSLKKGEMVLCLIALVGIDEDLNTNALTVDLDRDKRVDFGFGKGGHTCLGRHLAKMEMETLYRRWLEQIPEFEIDTTKPPAKPRGGSVMGIPALWLRWD